MRREYYGDEELEKQPVVSRRAVLAGLGGTAATSGTGLAGYVTYRLGFLDAPPEFDRSTGCLLSTKVEHATFVLTDATDPLTAIHFQRLLARLEWAASSMPDYGLIGIFVLNPDDAAGARQLFWRCAPRSPSGTSIMKGGSVYLRQEWARKFQSPLLASVRELADSTVRAERSPIIATIAGLTQRPQFDGSVADRRLVVVSDMLEHDLSRNGYSHLRGGDLMSGYHHAAVGSATRADLRGVRVTVDYLLRSEPEMAKAQTQAHRDFWRWWFITSGATEVSFAGIRESPVTPRTATEPSDKARRASK